jgi:hypothetical protein
VVTNAQVVPPLKSADFRVTVSTNREAVQLADVFADMLAQVRSGRTGGPRALPDSLGACCAGCCQALIAHHTCPALQANPQHAEALSRSQATNVLGFLFPGGQEASILVSKHGGRYRLQGNAFEALWLVLAELSRRLAEHDAAAAKKPQPAGAGAVEQPTAPFAIMCDDALPLQVGGPDWLSCVPCVCVCVCAVLHV